MIKDKPPLIYKKLKEQFGVSWEQGVIITYAPDIYWIGGNNLPAEKVVHEKTHLRQQTKMGVEIWWERYLKDKTFRFSQEVEAYKNEAEYIRRTTLNKQKRFKMINEIAKQLSSSMYGNLCSYNEALSILK